jgi:hypothetical protein
MTTNLHEEAARTRKAIALADILDAVTSDIPDPIAWLRDAPAAVRLDAAECAGIRLPSEETWQLACSMLEGRLAVRAALTADPFEGLTP